MYYPEDPKGQSRNNCNADGQSKETGTEQCNCGQNIGNILNNKGICYNKLLFTLFQARAIVVRGTRGEFDSQQRK